MPASGLDFEHGAWGIELRAESMGQRAESREHGTVCEWQRNNSHEWL